jgi:uncharacterized integral membrane protein (TIGR00698 family)
MEAVLRAPAPVRGIAQLLIPLGALACCLPSVSTGEGLLLGLVIALACGNPYLAQTRKATQKLLPISIVGLGAGMDLRMVVSAGAHGVLYTIAGITFALCLGTILARLLRVGGKIGALISVGTAICGGSAIAAMVPVLKPKEHETSVALATVFLLNAVALFAFPAIGHMVGLSDSQFGLWSALAIHDTSSVVGAALAFGGKAVEIATTVKLARALWIVPLTIVVGQWQKRRGSGTATDKPRRPWFILGFVLAAALVTYAPLLQPAGHLAARAARQALVVTLFLIGAGLTRSALRATSARPLFLGVLLWISVAAASLAAIVAGVAA